MKIIIALLLLAVIQIGHTQIVTVCPIGEPCKMIIVLENIE